MELRKRIFTKYVKGVSYLYPVIKPFSVVTNVLTLRSVDETLRYSHVNRLLKGQTILEVGASILSPIFQLHRQTLTTDVRFEPGVMALATVLNLPFRERTFDTVVAVDVIEHIPKHIRGKAIEEMIRVSDQRVIITYPLENGKDYCGRQMDISFNKWHKTRHGVDIPYALEHISCQEPDPEELTKHGFKLFPFNNTQLWLSYMKIQYWFQGILPGAFSNVAAHLYYAFHKSYERNPLYWGAVCTLDKA